MAAKVQRPKGRKTALSLLNAAIEAVNVAKDAANATPAQVAFSAAVVLLTMIRVSSLLFRDEMFWADTEPGFDAEPTGVR